MSPNTSIPDEKERATILARKLSHKSTIPERIEALTALGVTISELASTIGVSDESVRGWLKQSSTPRRQYSNVIDDIRAVALILLDGDFPVERITSWFHSTPPGHRRAPRPIDVITSDPQAVAAAAVAEIDGDHEDMAKILYDARRPAVVPVKRPRKSKVQQDRETEPLAPAGDENVLQPAVAKRMQTFESQQLAAGKR